MNAQIIPYSFDGNPVRITLCDDDPWFVLSDVCAALGLDNSSAVAARLDDDEKDDLITNDTIGRSQRMIIINESGLYSVIFESRKPIAKRFKKWVTSEVLPTIRKTGGYRLNSRDDFLSAIGKLVEPIKGRFAEHDQQLGDHEDRLDDHEDRLGAVEGRIVSIQDYKRKDFSMRDKRRLARVIDACFGGMDPVTGERRITDGRGNFLPEAEIDHFNNLRNDNRIENALPMHRDTHRRKTAGENFLAAYNEFHRKRLDFEGRTRLQPSLPGAEDWK